MLTVLQVAESLGVTGAAVHKMIKDGRLPAVQIGKLWRIHPDSLRAALEARNAPAPSDRMELDAAADQLGVSVATVRRQLLEGRLPGGKVGRSWWVSKAGLEAIVVSALAPHATDPPPAAEAGSHGAGGHPAAAPVGVDRAARTERAAGNDKPARRVAGGR